MEKHPYRGHVIWLDPEQIRGRWEPRVAVDVHAKGQTERIWYADHTLGFPTREEAVEASRQLGERMVDNFTVPGVGEGDYAGGT
jgi:hypothetical protein